MLTFPEVDKQKAKIESMNESSNTGLSGVLQNFGYNPKLLITTGALLFFLGLAGFATAIVEADAEKKIGLVLSTSFLLALGYPLLLAGGIAKRIATLEARIAKLEGAEESTDK